VNFSRKQPACWQSSDRSQLNLIRFSRHLFGLRIGNQQLKTSEQLSMDVIIDGYNLIFQCGLEGSVRNPRTIEKSRGRLISMLAQLLPPAQISRTTIVFDAKRLPASESQIESRKTGIRVLFAVDYDDADSMIEDLITTHSTPKKLLVVSSDHRIQKAATRRKAKAIDSDVWLDKLESSSSAAVEKLSSSSEGDITDQSIAGEFADIDWNAEFGAANIQATIDLVHSQDNPIDADNTMQDTEKLVEDTDWIAEMGLEDFDAPAE